MSLDGEQSVDILIVDDRAENLLALEAVLSSSKYRLIRANSGAQALDYLSTHDCAVILLDVQMPIMDGFETARRIRQQAHTREIPIIFLTAIHREDQYAQFGYEVGAVDFLTKPLDVVALRSKVAVFVQLHLKSKKLLQQEKLLHLANLRMSEERLRTVISHASVMLWSVDSEGLFTLCEGKGYHLDSATMLGQSAYQIYRQNPKIEANIRRALRGETFVAEVELYQEWYDVHHAPLFGLAGEIVGMIGVSAEITSRKQAEVSLQQAVYIRDEFLSIASHELKTPLTPLRLQLQLLQRQAKKKKNGMIAVGEILPKLDMAESQIIRMSKLIDDLLDVSRMSNRHLSVHREDMDLVATVKEVLDRFSEQARLAGCPVSSRLPDVLSGRWDRMRMEQVLTNLVSNAIKYGAGGPIQIVLEEDAGLVSLTITDHGIGISQENQDRIFERFERAVTGSEFGGLGLGLYIVRQLVEAHHGKIWVSSALGQGSTFTVSIPCFPPAATGLTRPTSGERHGLSDSGIEPSPIDQSAL